MTQLLNEKLTDKPVDAASVVLVREHEQKLQTLLLCRGNSRTVMNSAWVFPGGKVDPADLEQTEFIQSQLSANARDLLNEPDLNNEAASALFSAAVRETSEETAVTLKVSELFTWSRWITPNEPSMMKKRFDARFFIAAMPDGQTAVHDGQEATDSAWYQPAEALNDYLSDKIVLAPPQIMTLVALARMTSIEACLNAARDTEAYKVEPKALKTKHGRSLLFPGDEQHPEISKQMPGPTRLIWSGKHFEPPGGFEQFLSK